jgi:hypothetical protein
VRPSPGSDSRKLPRSAASLSVVNARAAIPHELDDGIDRQARGDFAGVVAAHAVGDHAEPQLLLNREAVFVGRPDAALVSESVSL